MRYLSYRHIEIDTHNQMINNNGEASSLAPKVYDLLLYFCTNSQRVISKDELMEQVWAGTLVTENAISRTLVKVRKALEDDPKEPDFIITVPRKGYRMAKTFQYSDTSIVPPQTNAKSENKLSTSDTTSFKLPILIGLILAFLILLIWWQNTQSHSQLNTKQLEAMSRDIGQELYPSVSPDLNHLAYTKSIAGTNNYLVIEKLDSGAKTIIQRENMSLSRLVWSKDNKTVMFLAKSNQTCAIYSTRLEEINNSEDWKLITSCGEHSTPHLVVSPNTKHLYFNDKLTNTNGYQIFKVNLLSGQKEILNQPITGGRGNYSFDISPNGQRLVLLNSEFAPKTAIYTLDLDTAELTRTGQLDYLMRSVTFHHDSLSIIHPSPHPAYELWQSSLDGAKLSVVASNTSRVKHVQRLNNGQDFTFVSYLLNRDIDLETYSNDIQNLKKSVTNSNSSVMDYLPALANHSNTYAFVSKRTSESQVYLVKEVDAKLSQPVRLTNFEQHIKLYRLAFSPDDSRLLIMADNQLLVANLNTKSIKKLPLNNLSIQGVSWKSNDELLFTTIKNNNWYLEIYDLTSETLKDVVSDYFGGLFIPELNQYALLSKNEGAIQLMSEKGELIKTYKTGCQPSFEARKLNLQLAADFLVCFSQQQNQYIQLNLLSGEQAIWQFQPDNLDFDINNRGVIHTKMAQAIADVMRTSGH